MGALLPPADFAARFKIPISPPAARPWWRLALTSRPALVDWDERPGATRFVSAAGGYEILYLAQDKRTAFWEVYANRLLPLAERDRVLPPGVLADRQWVKFDLPSDLRVFDATKIANVRAIGASNACFHGEWPVSQAWAEALWHHPQRVDGILYRSDKNTPRRCVAIFRRAGRAPLRRIKATAVGVLGDDGSFLSAMRKKGYLAHG